MTDLANLRALMERATPGPWAFHRDADGDPWVVPEPRGTHGAVFLPYNQSHEESDAHLAVAMRAALPKLLAVAEAAKSVTTECDIVRGDECMQALRDALADLEKP